MSRGTDAFDDIEAELGRKGWSYKERDVPPNQAFQNLEARCSERLRGWQKKSFEEKVQIDMEISSYLGIMKDLLLQHGIKLPRVNRLDTRGLKELEGLHDREVLAGMIDDTRSLIERLELGKQYARDLFQAYEDLIDYDPRVNPILREELKASLKPVALQEAMQQIQKAGGAENPSSTIYMLEESRKLGEPINQLVSQRHQGRSNTALVPVDRTLIEAYVRNYFKLEVIFKALHWRAKKETQELARLEHDIQQHGGPLTPIELQRLNQFEGGRDPDRNIGVYTAYLDYLRFTAETVFRHGWPDGGRGR